MGFPENFKIPVTDNEAYSLFPRSVVVPMVEKIAEKMVESLFENKDNERAEENLLTPNKRGKLLEDRVALWLNRSYGFNVETNEQVNGKYAKRPYEVDVHAWKKTGSLVKTNTNLWIECKALNRKVVRNELFLLIQKAKDVRENEYEWNPDLLLLISEKGFDIDVKKLGKRHSIYLLKADTGKFRFIGEMKREDFKKLKPSNY